MSFMVFQSGQSSPLKHSLTGSQLSGHGPGIDGLQSLIAQKNTKTKKNITAVSRVFRIIFLIRCIPKS